MKKHLVFLLTIFLIAPQISLANTPSISGGEIIGTVNGENLLLSEYKRLVSSQRKSFHKNLDFDLFSKKTEGLKKREDQLKKAKNEGLSVSHEEFSSAWEDVLESNNGINNLEKTGKENKLLLVDIQRKLEDNVLLDKYFDKHIKEKLLQVMVDELIILQEAKARDLQVPEELVIKKLELIEEKQGGEEAFRKFLAENNATIEDAKQEVKNQFLYEFIKEDVAKELHTDNKDKIKNYFRNKREESKVIVYDEKIPGPKITLAKLVNESKVKPKEQDKKEELVIAEAKVPEIEIASSDEIKASKVSSDVSREINDEIASLEEQVVEINKDLQKKKESRDVSRNISASDLLKKKEEVEASNRKKAELALAKKQEKEAQEAKKAELALAKKQEMEAQEAKKAELALAKKQEMEAQEAKKAELALAKKQEMEAQEAKKAELALAKKQEMEAQEAKKAELALAKKQEMEAQEAKKAELALAKKQELEAIEAKKAELTLAKGKELEAQEVKKAELALARKQEAEALGRKKIELTLSKKQIKEAEELKKAELALAKKQEKEAEQIKKAELAFAKKQEAEVSQVKKAELALAKKQEKEAEQIKKAELALIKKQTEVSTKKENRFDNLDKKMEEKRKIALKKKIDKYALVKAKEKQKEKLDQVVPGQPIATEPIQMPSEVSTIAPVNEQTFDISKELQELRKKIEERRVTTK